MIKLCGDVYDFNYKIKDNNLKWELITINIDKYDTFKVYYCEYKNKKLIKPYEPYFIPNFEILFDFGYECKNYNHKKIIDITNAIN